MSRGSYHCLTLQNITTDQERKTTENRQTKIYLKIDRVVSAKMECTPALLVTYILALEGGKYYVGKSYGLNVRLGQHWTGNGARWTRIHKPTDIEAMFIGDKEREKTLYMMYEYGWKNVRGGGWCKVDMDKPPKALKNYKPEES